MRHHITIPGELPSMNQIIAKSKQHYGAYAAMKKKYTGLVIEQAKDMQPIGKADFVFTWYCKDKRKDPDNVAAGGTKMCLDGLVEAGVMEGDGWGQVNSLTHMFQVDKNFPRVEIEIFEVK